MFGGRRDGQGNVGAAAADRRVVRACMHVRRRALWISAPMTHICHHKHENTQTLAHLAARPGKQGGSALLAPEQPGDVAVVELLGVGPQQQQGEGGGAVVVVRGAASVLARFETKCIRACLNRLAFQTSNRRNNHLQNQRRRPRSGEGGGQGAAPRFCWEQQQQQQ